MNWLQWTITSSLLNWGLCFPASPHLSGPPTKRRTCKTLANWSDATDFTLKVVLQPDEITDRWSCGLVGCCIVLVLLCSNSLLALNIKGGDGGVWWAAIYGVAQSRTQLKWLSSSSMYTQKLSAADPQKEHSIKLPNGISFYGSILVMGCIWLLRLIAC